MKVVVVGTGYVGLVTGACLSDVGIEVVCIDIDHQKIENLKKGIMPIYEPGLEEIISRNFSEGRLNFTTDIDQAVKAANVAFESWSKTSIEERSAYLHKIADAVEENKERFFIK